MRRIFGKAKEKVPAPTLGEQLEKADGRVDHLDAKIAKLDKELLVFKKQLKTAKGGAKNSIKQRALRALKQKKMYEQQRDKQSSVAFNMEQINMTKESMSDTIASVDAMKSTAKEMKKAFKNIKIDKIEDLHDDLDDLMMDNDEIQEVMGQSFGDMDAVDDDDLEDELAALDDDMFEDDIEDDVGVGTMDLPSAPAGVVQGQVVDEQPEGKIGVDEYGLPVAN
jgi:charged multivesicular body protein 5